MALPSTSSPSKTHHAKPTSPKSKPMKKQSTGAADVSSVAKRNNDPGVRLVGGRIYDSQNGKTCHQCRQKTMDFTAACKNQKNGKPCTIRFCHKCLLNRYGEKAEEKDLIDEWNCPKCRGKCNCSVCMKKKGQKPTGILVHTAKATGFSSVSEMLDVNSPDIAVKDYENEGTPSRKNGEGNSSDGIIKLKSQDLGLKAGLDSKKSKKRKHEVLDKTSVMNSELKNQDLTSTAEPIQKKLMKKKHEGLGKTSDMNSELKNQDLTSTAEAIPKKLKKKKHDGLDKTSDLKTVVKNQDLTSMADPIPKKLKKKKHEGLDQTSDLNSVVKNQDLASTAEPFPNKLTKNKHEGLDKTSDLNTVVKYQDLASTTEAIPKKLKKKKHGISKVSSEKNADLKPHGLSKAESGKNNDLKSQDLSSAADLNPKKPRKRKHGLSKETSGQNTENGGLEGHGQSIVSIQFEDSNNVGTPSKLEDNGHSATGYTKKGHKSSKTCQKGLMESRCLEQKTSVTVGPTKNNVAGREVVLVGNGCIKLKMQAETHHNNVNSPTKMDVKASISPPVASDLTSIAGIELPSGDVGHALQFLEFCAAFGKIFNMRKGQAELIIREIVGSRERRRAQYSVAAHFHIELINVIQKDSGEACTAYSQTTGQNLWFQALRKCICNSKFWHILTNVTIEDFLSDSGGYNAFDSSKKLILLNFLCDEALNTEKMRSWIEKEYSKYLEREKACREQVAAAKEKERDAKKKMQDELAKALIAKSEAPLTVSEHEAVVSQIKLEAAEAHAQMLEAKGGLPNKSQRISAARTEPIFVDSNGNRFWRLNGHGADHNFLLQEIKEADGNVQHDQWLAYDVDQKSDLELYISARKKEKLRARPVVRRQPLCKPAGSKI